MKNKSAASLVAALTTTFTNDWPKTLQTDQGLEFLDKIIRSGSIEEVRHPSLLHTQRGDEGEHCGNIQQNVEDAHVAILHEPPDVAIHRRPSGLGAIVQQHPPPQHWHGSVTGKCTESRKGVAAPVRSRR